MSLTPEELGITSDQWTTLATSTSKDRYDVMLYQWLPEYGTLIGELHDFPDFDAILFDDAIYRAAFYTFEVLATDVTYVLGYTPDPDALSGTPPSLATDGDNLAIFVATDTGISLNTFDGATFTDFAEIITDSTIKFIAATTVDTVHFLTYDSTHHYYQFHVAVLDGTWSVIDSDIYWAYKINAFAGKRVQGRDVLTIASDMPGIPSMKVVGTKVTKEILPTGGIVAFTYQYETWSDHRMIDDIDQWNSFRYRSALKMSVIDDTLWLMAYSSEGSVDAPVTGYRLYSSKDGRHWSRGELLPTLDAGVAGMMTLAHSTTLYQVGYTHHYTAKRTLKFGTPHADTQLSLVGKILAMQVTRRDIQEIQLTLDNRRLWLNSTIADGSRTLALILQTGFDTLLIQTGIFEVETVEFSQELPEAKASLVARDHLSWMAGKSQSEQFLNWTPQVVGIDEYIDTTATGYGGMTHSAPALGSFQAFDGALQLASNNEEGLAYNTWLSDTWNCAVESFVSLATLGNSEYAGLVFRSPDKDNGFFYYYDQASDKLKLDRRTGGTPTNLWQSSAKSWSGSLSGHYLRAEPYYNHIYLYSSDDGSNPLSVVEWTAVHDLIVDGEIDTSTPLVQSGYVGSFGKGFSNLTDSFGVDGVVPVGDLPLDYSAYDTPAIPAGSPPDPVTPVAIASYDFIAAVNITPISAGTACGVVGAGAFDTGGDGLTTPNSLKHPINFSNERCDQNSFNVAPPMGDTWISVTEVRFHMKLDFPDGGPAGNNWYTVSAKVYGPSDPGGTVVYSHLYIDTYGLQMAYAEVIVPINYIHQVTSIDILNVWEHLGAPFDNAPGSYLANMTVYGLVTH